MIKLLRSILSRIPGGKWFAARCFKPDASNPHAYLYDWHTLSWITRREFKSQLPLLYRCFARYCALALYQGRVVGGATAFRWVSWLTRTFAFPQIGRLDAGSHIVYLNLVDPRMLKVPNELLHKQANCTRELDPYVKLGDTFVDLGGNHGSFSIAASKLVGAPGRVVTVEPQPVLSQLIRQSLAANAASPFEVCECACGDCEGQVEFYVPAAASGSAGMFASYSATAEHHKIQVALHRFDTAFEWRHFPGHVFVKLDVEGSELSVLRGASEMIHSRHPHIMMELNPAAMKAAGVTLDQLLGFLSELGYDRFSEVDAPEASFSLETLRSTGQRNIVLLPPVLQHAA